MAKNVPVAAVLMDISAFIAAAGLTGRGTLNPAYAAGYVIVADEDSPARFFPTVDAAVDALALICEAHALLADPGDPPVAYECRLRDIGREGEVKRALLARGDFGVPAVRN